MKRTFSKHGKRLLAVLLTAALLIGSLAVCGLAITEDRFGDAPSAYGERLYGDVNWDDKVDIQDYILVKRVLLKTARLSTDGQFLAADINKNGRIDVGDCLFIKRILLNTVQSPGVIVEELRPNPYASLTDEELYALIDEELADPNQEGINILAFSFQRIKRESQASAVLASLGFSDDLYDETVYLRLARMWDMHLGVYMIVPMEQLREAMFKLRRCDEIANCDTHGDQISFPD